MHSSEGAREHRNAIDGLRVAGVVGGSDAAADTPPQAAAERDPFPNARLRRALVASNLLNLGVPPQEALDEANAWLSRQQAAANGFRSYLMRLSALPLALEGENELRADGRLYVSVHQFPYQLIYRALQTRRPLEICILSGRIPAHAIRAYCEVLNGAFGCSIRFIQSGFSMLREAKAALRSACVVTYIDVPWTAASSDAGLDRAYAVKGGTYRSRTSFERLVRNVDPDACYVGVSGDPGSSATLRFLGACSFERMYALMMEQLLKAPNCFQNLDRLHKQFVFERPAPWAVAFEEGGARYVLCADTMKAYRSHSDLASGPQVLFASEPATQRIRSALRREIEGVLVL